MKKTFTLLIGVVIAAILSVSGAFAQTGTYYKKYLLNQDFTGWTTLPAGWSSNTSSSHYRNAGVAVTNNTLTLSASNGGNGRGGMFSFPATNSSDDADFATATLWNFEFDITIRTAQTGYKNAFSIVFGGANDDATANPSTYYLDGIFGFFVYGGTNIHYMNMDNVGVPVLDGTGADTGESSAPAVRPDDSNNGFGRFTRAGADQAGSDALCLSTKTKVAFTKGTNYHVKAVLNFATQFVDSLIIYQTDNMVNGDTILSKPFLSQTFAGASCTSHPDAPSRIVNDLSRCHFINTRASNVGNGDNTNIDVSLNKWDVYVWKESLGVADVTINYVDRDNGNTVKSSRVAAQQEVGFIYNLLSDDMNNFSDATNWYLYDADATHAANASKGSGENLTVESQTGSTPNPANTLTVVFKKETKSTGTYIWNGNTSYKWNYLDNNFSVSGGSDISYQPGNAVGFSRTDATNMEVLVDGAIELADADMTVSAPGYTLTSTTGYITGNGSLKINAPVTLAADNRLVGGAVINTDQTVSIQSASAATQFTAANQEITLDLNAGATFNKSITGSGGTLNANLISVNECASSITGFSTVNIGLTDRGRETGNAWTNPFTSIISDGTQVNVIDATNQDPIRYPATYAVAANSVANAKVHLGDNTRIILNGTTSSDNSSITVNIGEVSGTASSSIQGNSVGVYTRTLKYSIGALNTDAVFDGSILPQLTREPSRRSGTKNVWAPLTVEGDTVWYLPSTMQLEKVGTGTWTVGGKIIIPDADSPSTVTVTAGTLELLDSLVAPADLNLVTLTVNNGSTLKMHGNYIGAFYVTNNGTVEGGGEYANSFMMIDPASVLKLKVNSFAAGDYEFIKTEEGGDITIKNGKIDITVDDAKDGQIVILEAGGNYDIIDNIESGNVKVLVNGEDISNNSVDTPIPDGKTYMFYFDSEQGILGVKGSFTGLPQVSATDKIVKSIEYYNLLGQQVTKNNIGVTLHKITYTDGSVHTEKVYNRVK